ncbi:hypothetical protein [Dysgonomonas macrotermitis]|uniref:Phosphate-selective porin O and P n=1 Tax=Dysgonomonas macrotermitis TaxID=1346286 RepID=A0A1M5ARP7_9BACT|nr:hypothetical protein [Dysgonomonas macrotermitis]SHF32865.1 hypothetical protein SAMN05444362_105138 [Dysgonomonas macrotermitis]
MKQLLILLFLLCAAVTVRSQKTIEGDTTTWYRHTKHLFAKLGCKDLLESGDEFNFRMQYFGQVIDIRKNQDTISGFVIDYIFKLGKKGKTISTKTSIADSLAIQCYQLINNSGILDIETDKKIEGWQQGYDGIIYSIEYAGKDNYQYNKYWTPQAQSSTLNEAVIVNKFVDNISAILNLKERYAEFRNNIARHGNGTYTNGGMSMLRIISENYEAGYSGSVKYPIGYILRVGVEHIGSLKTNLGFRVEHQFDGQGNYDFSGSAIKSNLFIRKTKGINDFIYYTYRQRKHEDLMDGTKFRNHTTLYGVNLKYTSLAAGVEFSEGEKSQTGFSMYMSRYLPLIRSSVTGKASVFDNRFDYRIDLSRFFSLGNKSFRSFNSGIYYEYFARHGNIGWSVCVPF